MVYKVVSIHDTGPNLSPELGRRFGFTTHNGTNMRLKNAHDTVFACMSAFFKHLQLLIIHLDDGCCNFPFITIQAVKQQCTMHSNQINKAAKITEQIV